MGVALGVRSGGGNGDRSVLESIGRRPLFRLRRVAQAFPGMEACAKAEPLDPGGRVKDRAALNMGLYSSPANWMTHFETMALEITPVRKPVVISIVPSIARGSGDAG